MLGLGPRKLGALVCLASLITFAILSGARDANAARASGERPLPSFQGFTLDGKLLSISDYIGKRLVLFFFNPEIPEARPAAEAIRGLSTARGTHNFAVVGIAVGSSRSKARAFRDDLGLDFPIIDDSGAAITRRLGLQSPITVIGADSEGYMTFGVTRFDTEADHPAEDLEDHLRKGMRLPQREPAPAQAFGLRPRAPNFEALRLSGGSFDFAELEGKPVVLMFFLHTCSHCHAALRFMKTELKRIPEAKRPPLIGVSLLDRPAAVRQMIEEEGFELTEVLFDPDREVQRLYGTGGGVPDIAFINAEGRIVHRVQGWREKRDPALARMVLAKIAGEKIPMLLNPKGYTGADVCGVCHELEAESWGYTKHATAFATLVTHGKERDAECVSCHVVGFDQPGGYAIDAPPVQLENVGCENCHGRGGPHLSKTFVRNGNYADVCQTCHNPTHSLGFDYAVFRPVISHTAIASMTPEEREALGRSRPVKLLPTEADYVGSEACKSCHTAEFETWSKSPHSRALASLESKRASAKSECQRCHTTGFAQPGGFSPKEDIGSHRDLARVGCESCHGPGSAHVGAEAKRIGTIISLGDKCDSCVILQICGSCHDDANDPGFEFEVVEKIELQRHGTIEAGTGRPIEARSAAQHPAVERIHVALDLSAH